MAPLTELGQRLHEEHFRILVLICGLENRITGHAAERPLDRHNAEEREQIEELIASLRQVIDHNTFEEAVLFPLISDHRDGELAHLLIQAHVTIGPMARRLRAVAVQILELGASVERWAEFRDAARGFVAEMMRHLQKEELAVVQRLDSFLDADTDHRLALRHATERPPAKIKLASGKIT